MTIYLYRKSWALQTYLQQINCNQGRSNPYPDIVRTSNIVNGEPRLSGRLMSVKDIVNTIQYSDSLTEVVDEYQITLSQIRQALQYCSGKYCKQDLPKEFCSTCSLCKEQKGPLNMSDLEEVTFDNTTYVRGNDSLFLGTMNELLEDWNGRNWWEIATDLLIDFRNELFNPDNENSVVNHFESERNVVYNSLL